MTKERYKDIKGKLEKRIKRGIEEDLDKGRREGCYLFS